MGRAGGGVGAVTAVPSERPLPDSGNTDKGNDGGKEGRVSEQMIESVREKAKRMEPRDVFKM